jgi:hypothetical protein
MNGSRPDADEPDFGTAKSCGKTPPEEDIRDTPRPCAVIIQNPGAWHDQEVELAHLRHCVNPICQVARRSAQEAIQNSNHRTGAAAPDGDPQNPKIILHLVGRRTHACEFCVGPHLAQKNEHRLQRTIIPPIAATEPSEESNSFGGGPLSRNPRLGAQSGQIIVRDGELVMIDQDCDSRTYTQSRLPVSGLKLCAPAAAKGDPTSPKNTPSDGSYQRAATLGPLSCPKSNTSVKIPKYQYVGFDLFMFDEMW